MLVKGATGIFQFHWGNYTISLVYRESYDFPNTTEIHEGYSYRNIVKLITYINNKYLKNDNHIYRHNKQYSINTTRTWPCDILQDILQQKRYLASSNTKLDPLSSLISTIPTLYGKLICHSSGLHESAESDQRNLIKLGVDLHLLTPQTW